jgi:hypothetical protein
MLPRFSPLRAYIKSSCDPVRDRANFVFGKRNARLLEFFITGRLPSKSGGAAYHRLHCRLLRPVFSNLDINNFTAATTSASERYVQCAPVSLFIMFCVYMFSCYLFPFILLFSTSSMFELHVVVAVIVMFNILELIMEIVPNSPTIQKPNCRQFPELSMAGFTNALRLDKFTGLHFKRWQYKAELWLTTMKVFQISKGKPEGTISNEDHKKFKEANTVYVGCILSILADRLCDVFMHI